MLKKDLVVLVAQLRAENSLLRTQLAAAQSPQPSSVRLDYSAAAKRLAARHPERKSFTATEVCAEAKCSA
jgi:hypothetical protein